MDMTPVDWAVGEWTHAPASVVVEGGALVVGAVEGSDAWRVTSYGFTHDSEHGLLAPLPQDAAVEVTFVVDYAEQFDQAGVLLRAAEDRWIKAGVEVADGVPQVGAVVTNPVSDWSVGPVPAWVGRSVTVRASRSGDAVTIRAGIAGEPLRLVRVAPFPADATVEAGPYCCAPTRAGLVVRFTRWATGPADAALHG